MEDHVQFARFLPAVVIAPLLKRREALCCSVPFKWMLLMDDRKIVRISLSPVDNWRIW